MNKILLITLFLLFILYLIAPKLSVERTVILFGTVIGSGILNYRLAKENHRFAYIWVLLSIFGILSVLAHYGVIYINKKLVISSSATTKAESVEKI